jgi:hypothetical protein
VPQEAGLTSFACPGSTCGYQGPGVYPKVLALSGTTTFASGTYVLHKGLDISGNGTVSGSGILLVNGCGSDVATSCTASGGPFTVAGQAAIDFTGPASGTYAGILYFQPAANTSAVSITGGASVQSLGGILYAPGSSGVTLGSGGGGLKLGAVIGTNLTVAGNGTVVVGGS